MTPDARAHLETAAALVDLVVGGLNTSRRTCGECGIAHYEDFAEYQAAKELTGVAQKIRRWASRRPEEPAVEVAP